MRPKQFSRAQAMLEYSFLIALVVGVAIGMQNYLKRGMQGQLRASADQTSDQYSYGFTDLHEHFTHHESSTEWKFPGPADVINKDGAFTFRSDKELATQEHDLSLIQR